MRLLRRGADRRTVAFVLSYFIWVIFLWSVDPSHPMIKFFGVLLASLLSWAAAIITHNTLHYPIFVRRSWNRVFQVILTVTYGFPVSEYIPGHNLSHHRFTQTPRDLMRTSKVRFKSNLVNFFAFMPAVAGGVTRGNMRYARLMKDKRPEWYKQFLLEFVACWGSKIVLLMVDWEKCLFYIVIPHFFALWAITTINYVWHDGCDMDSPYNHSRNFIGKIFNWFTFNNGYHGMHHMKPGLHWSLLPEAHKKYLHPYVHPALEQDSLLSYLYRSLISPGKRLQYDGSPIQLPPIQEDEEWISVDPSKLATVGSKADHSFI